MILRPYQQRVIHETWSWFESHRTGHPIVEACVAAGKSVVMAAMAHQAMTAWPSTRIVVLTHQKELLEQNAEKLKRVWPNAPVGIWSAALGEKTIGDITFATIGSIYKDAHLLGAIALIFVDECHLVNPKEEGMMRAFIDDVQRYGNPKVRVIGFTGTPFRGNGVWLTAGKDALFTHIISRIKMKELLELGFLAPLVPAKAPTLIDTKGIRVIGDDFDKGELAARADQPTVVAEACRMIVQLAKDRKRWLIFCVNVAHAMHVADELQDLGIRVGLVLGETPSKARDEVIGFFRRGHLQCLVNVGVATTGFDVPEIDFIALLRPTRSPVLYTQMMGRGMRIADGKTDCLVADFTPTVQTLGPVDAISGRQARGGGKKGAPFKICSNCGSQCAIADKECPECHAPFPIEERDPHGDKPTGAALLTSQLAPAPEEVPFKDVSFELYPKNGKTSVQVRYANGVFKVATEWIHFEQPFGSTPRLQASSLWQQWTGYSDCPKKADDAIAKLRRMKKDGTLRLPRALVLDTTGKYPIILKRVYEPIRAGSADGGLFGSAHQPAEGTPPPTRDQGGVQNVRSLSKWVLPAREADGEAA